VSEDHIFVRLMHETVGVWRPVRAERLEDNHYRSVEQRYDRDTEEWRFEPGDRVVCELIDSSEGSFLPPSVGTPPAGDR
jgi:hypothetical protein